jgi:hypothetical protein
VGQFYIVLPQATENIHSNPSGEIDTTGYTAVGSGASVARVSDESYRGAWSIKNLSGSTNTGGHYYGTKTLTSGRNYTFSAWVKGVLGQAYKIYIASTSGTALATTTFTGTGDWQRVEVSYLETSTSSRRFYITKNGGSTTSTALYVDASQIEALPYSTTYCDGDQEGCKWVGGALGAHKSASARTGMSRAGGRKVDLDNYNAYLVSQSGTGMPPMKNSSVAYANGAGAFWRGQLATERSFTIAFSVSGNGVPDWHSRRQALIDAIKPDLVTPQQDFILGYTDGGEDIEIRCHYDGGFELADGKLDIETLPLKVIASDPYWYTLQEQKYFIDAPSRMIVGSSAYAVFRDSTGNWILPGGTGPTGGKVSVVKAGPDGFWYFGGLFTSCGGVANTAYFAKYDPDTDTFSSMGTFNGEVKDIGFDAFGQLIVCGAFTTVSGNAYPYVVKHNGSVFQQLNGQYPNAAVSGVVVVGNNTHVFIGAMTGLTGSGSSYGTYCMGFYPDMSIAGGFTGSWGGYRSFNVQPTGILAKQNTQDVIIYGQFTTCDGVAATHGLIVNSLWTANPRSALGQPAGTTGGPRAVVVSRDNVTVYAIYQSTTAVPVGDINAGNVYHLVLGHSGSGWVQYGQANGYLDFMDIDPTNDDIYVSSNRPPSPASTSPARSINGIFTFFSAIYTGNRWVHGATMTIWDGVAFDELGNSCIWYSTAGTNSGGYDNFSVHATVTNAGSAEVQPNIVMTGYGRFMWAKNWTTGATLFGGLSAYQYDQEKTTINTALGTVSSNRRPVFSGILTPNSALGQFTLVPGDNEIEIWFEYNTLGVERSGIDLWLWWREKHWSIDGGTA